MVFMSYARGDNVPVREHQQELLVSGSLIPGASLEHAPETARRVGIYSTGSITSIEALPNDEFEQVSNHYHSSHIASTTKS
jgi:hypothetical protein